MLTEVGPALMAVTHAGCRTRVPRSHATDRSNRAIVDEDPRASVRVRRSSWIDLGELRPAVALLNTGRRHVNRLDAVGLASLTPRSSVVEAQHKGCKAVLRTT